MHEIIHEASRPEQEAGSCFIVLRKKKGNGFIKGYLKKEKKIYIYFFMWYKTQTCFKNIMQRLPYVLRL